MLKLLKQCLALLIFFLVLPLPIAHAAVDLLPVNQIKPGMQGIAKTVVNGTKIEEFGVEVLGVMNNKGPSGDLILVRTYGEIIDRTGGIVQGMSGSPVYIDGKLVGAIAYGWPLSDHKIGMVTPIQDMLKLWDAPDFKNDREFRQIELTEDLEPVATPLMAAGFTEPALKMLADKLKPLNMIPYAVGGAPSDAQFGSIEPGSSIGVELVRGDISLSALGTVTYVEDGKVLAFGHPFLKKGNSSYFMTNAYIFTAVDGLESGFKVGTTGDAVGLINQDRSAGIAGQLDKYPNIVPIRIKVTDEQLGRTQDLAVQVIHDEQLVPALSASSVFNAVDKTIDRVGPGTARVSFEIMARDMPGEILKRENMFYTPGSIGELTVAEFFDAMNLLSNNKFNPVEIMDVKINISVSEERRTASIVEARAATSSVKPGDTVNLAVKLKPYRGEPITQTIPVIIPKNQPAGPLMLEVRGGGLIPVTQLLLKQQGIDLTQGKDKQKSFADVLKDFQTADHNNDIVVEMMDMQTGGLLEQADESANADPKLVAKPKANAAKLSGVAIGAVTANKELNKTKHTTDYIIDNDTKVMLNIIKP
ncbi:SpoIVB peptidase [Sporomusaceae bacterium FL31]|nr:SpoIVB peptidase [Sporomusaceae bacterium FL31]GCE33969.1 SpoIVB peptidase [Sporomusaceae bacterium]